MNEFFYDVKPLDEQEVIFNTTGNSNEQKSSEVKPETNFSFGDNEALFTFESIQPLEDPKVESVVDEEEEEIEEEVEENEEAKKIEVKSHQRTVVPKSKKVEKAETVQEQPEGEDEEVELTPEQENAVVLKNSVNYLIESGIWKDFEGREEVEWSGERFAEELKLQAEEYTQEVYEQAKNSHEFVSSVFDLLEKGGDPSKMIELYNRQYQTKEFDTATDDGKKGFILDFYVNVLGEKKNRTERLIEDESSNGSLQEFYEEVKAKSDSYFQKERESIVKEQEKIQAKQLADKQAYQQSMIEQVKSLNMNAKEGNELLHYMLTPKAKTKEGREVSQLEIEFYKMKQDPKEAVQLAQFLKNKDKYIQTAAQGEINKKTNQLFTSIRNSTKKTGGVASSTTKQKTQLAEFKGW